MSETNGPVFHGPVTGAQFAWGNNDSVNQTQHNTVAPGYAELADFITTLLRELPQAGLTEQNQQEAEAAAAAVLAEVQQPQAEPGRVRRAVTKLRDVLAPVGTGLVTGVAAGTQDWAQQAVGALTGLI